MGFSLDSFGSPLWVSYSPDGHQWDSTPLVGYQNGENARHADVAEAKAAEMLDFRPSTYGPVLVDGKKMVKICGKEPPGWFERTCAEANCAWFLPMVKRMAAGEVVPLEEIQSAYREHNEGKDMPCEKWGRLFSLEP